MFCEKISGPLATWLGLSNCQVFSFLLRILSEEWCLLSTGDRLTPPGPAVISVFGAVLQLVSLVAVFPVLGNAQQDLHPPMIATTSNLVYIDPWAFYTLKSDRVDSQTWKKLIGWVWFFFFYKRNKKQPFFFLTQWFSQLCAKILLHVWFKATYY